MIEMHEVIRVSRPIQVDESDVISLEEAARLSHRAVSVIGNMLDRGRLPWYQWRSLSNVVPGERSQRFTSRVAVLTLPKAGRKRVKTAG